MTRNADLVIEEDEASDLLQTIEDELSGRWFGQSARLVVTDSMPEELHGWLAENLGVDQNSVYAAPEPLGLADFEEFTHLDRGDLLYPPITPHIPDEIHIPLDGLEIGDSIHISQVTLPEGTKAAIDDRDFTVATIVAPSAMKAEEEEEAPEGEVPVVGEEGEEGEGGEAAEGESKVEE